jgi:hypothetical protein
MPRKSNYKFFRHFNLTLIFNKMMMPNSHPFYYYNSPIGESNPFNILYRFCTILELLKPKLS